MYLRRRNLVTRQDGRLVNVARPRGQLFVCAGGCCCGREEDGIPAVPVELYHAEWERRRLRNQVHLTIGGCLGPCALANVALLLIDGRALWFHSLNDAPLALALLDYAEDLLRSDSPVAPPEPLAQRQFTATAWQPRPDGQPVDDVRPHRPELAPPHVVCSAEPAAVAVDRLVAEMTGSVAAPRKNGELVFEAPWQGRAFGLAVALQEQQLYPWDQFRDRLIAAVNDPAAANDPFVYYERWLSAFEGLLVEQGIVTPAEIDERTFQFEYGERDDIV